MNKIYASLFAVAMLSTCSAGEPAYADGSTPVTTTPVVVAAQPAPDKFTTVNLDSQLPGTAYWGFDVGNGFQGASTNNRGNAAYYSLTYGRDLGLYDVEVEGFRSYTDGKPAIGNVDVFGVMVNGKAKYKNTSKFTPYAKLGLGAGLFDDTGVRDAGLAFVFSGGVGGSYEISENTSLDVGYTRMWSPTDVRKNGGGWDNYQEDVLTVGLNFKY